ncbi:hypothetical protein GUJ93_ZPchr0006g42924 [Zizania palustris]|uniref:Uncharacterized protein n=1 Tax=Zizania palustris TaxID=103762 RepID=A0A8J5SR46_ZIZPA|nr:hypothetical protein GUJ93_ZPchr0006g42924 [Zizania palustris]
MHGLKVGDYSFSLVTTDLGTDSSSSLVSMVDSLPWLMQLIPGSPYLMMFMQWSSKSARPRNRCHCRQGNLDGREVEAGAEKFIFLCGFQQPITRSIRVGNRAVI